MSNVLKLEKLPKEESLLLQGEEHSTNTALVMSNKDGAQVVAYVLKDGRVIDKPEFQTLETHNDMFSFLCQKFKELPTQKIPDCNSKAINPIIFKEDGEYYNIEFFKNDFSLTMDNALKRQIDEVKQTAKGRNI